MAYQLPPNDPRFLEMTDDEMAHDLLVLQYRQLRWDIDSGTERGGDAVRQTTEARSAMLRLATALRAPAFLDQVRTWEQRRASQPRRTVVKVVTTTRVEP